MENSRTNFREFLNKFVAYAWLIEWINSLGMKSDDESIGRKLITKFWYYRIGQFALKNIIFTLTGNYFVSSYLETNFFVTLLPLYMIGLMVHDMLGIKSPGSVMKDKFVQRMKNWFTRN